jgi:SRSO17 transposase
MSKTRLFKAPATPPVEAVMIVHSLSILILLGIIRREFAQLTQQFTKALLMAFVVFAAGLCCLAKKPTARAVAANLGGVSHDALTRFLNHASWNAAILMVVLLDHAIVLAGGIVTGQSWLILDDVLIPKPFAKVIAGAYWDWDHCDKRNVFGHRVVVLLWTNGVMLIPVAFALWHKKNSAYLKETERAYRTKNDLARCLVYMVKRRGLPFDYLTFDAWYAGVDNLNFFNRLKVTYYAAVKSNRTLTPGKEEETITCQTLAGRYRTRDFNSYRNGDARARGFAVKLKEVDHDQKLVIIKNLAGSAFLSVIPSEQPQEKRAKKKTAKTKKGAKGKKAAKPKKQKKADPNKYLITNNPEAKTYHIILCYRSRWDIEVTFRDLKQHLGLCACQHRSLEAVNRHIALSMFAFVCLQHLRLDLIKQTGNPHQTLLTIGDVKTRLRQQLMMAQPIPKDTVAPLCQVIQKPMDREFLAKLMDDPTIHAVIGSKQLCNAQTLE